MTSTELHLVKTGLIRRRYGLVRADGWDLGRIELGPHRGAWTDPGGLRWEYWTDGHETIASTGGSRRIESGTRDDGPYLRVDGQRFRMAFDLLAGRWARLRDPEGDELVLDAALSETRRGPFRTITVARALPRPFEVAAHLAFAMAYAYEEMRLSASQTGGGGGGGS